MPSELSAIIIYVTTTYRATKENAMDVKTIGSNGQVSLGKQHAGRRVLVEEQEPGVWLVRTVQVIPENEMWLHSQQAKDDLRKALEWASRNEPDTSNTQDLIEHISRS